MENQKSRNPQPLATTTHTTMPTSAFFKAIGKTSGKNSKKGNILNVRIGELKLPVSTQERRAQLEIQRKKRVEEEFETKVKIYRRRLDRLTIAKYLSEDDENLTFMEVCAGIEAKDGDILRLVKQKKDELVCQKFYCD